MNTEINSRIPVALTIAGFDSDGGTGIQADLLSIIHGQRFYWKDVFWNNYYLTIVVVSLAEANEGVMAWRWE